MYTFVEINNLTPTGTLDIYNTSTTVNILSLWNTSGSLMCSVSNTGLLTLAPLEMSNVMNIRGTVQAAFALPYTGVHRKHYSTKTQETLLYQQLSLYPQQVSWDI